MQSDGTLRWDVNGGYHQYFGMVEGLVCSAKLVNRGIGKSIEVA
ncbi:MAG: hypothetical protein ACTS4T_01200 [Candidatus Hodgkinia cicadicola]